MAKNWPHDFIVSFERAHFKVPEKYKIFEISHSKRKLWPFKDLQYIDFIIQYIIFIHENQ